MISLSRSLGVQHHRYPHAGFLESGGSLECCEHGGPKVMYRATISAHCRAAQHCDLHEVKPRYKIIGKQAEVCMRWRTCFPAHPAWMSWSSNEDRRGLELSPMRPSVAASVLKYNMPAG